ncbi:MAG: 4Fe-4S binding protein, partial [Firmicutes bacterium]|nr:4Fe-4S binding protein [Bacillota bacterium]
MKQLLIISGKGGTGKTSVTSAFAALAHNVMIADCDVDAANLHMFLQAVPHMREDFIGSKKAIIDTDLCTKCGTCAEYCRFNAVQHKGGHYNVEIMSCEGCGVCHLVCPADAIILKDHVSGQWFKSDSQYGPLVHAQLGIAEENSGKLVAKVKDEAVAAAEHKQNMGTMLVDGPPGTGCPVISSISGVSLALIVTEPTVAGLHDLKRIVELTSHFDIPAMVCINKYDLDTSYSEVIAAYCQES